MAGVVGMSEREPGKQPLATGGVTTGGGTATGATAELEAGLIVVTVCAMVVVLEAAATQLSPFCTKFFLQPRSSDECQRSLF